MGGNVNNVRFHDIANQLVFGGKQQVFHGHNAFQLAAAVRDIAGVHRLFFHADGTDAVKRLLHRHAALQIDVFHRHDGACAVFGVI